MDAPVVKLDGPPIRGLHVFCARDTRAATPACCVQEVRHWTVIQGFFFFVVLRTVVEARARALRGIF
jgi:hypothetical protein